PFSKSITGGYYKSMNNCKRLKNSFAISVKNTEFLGFCSLSIIEYRPRGKNATGNMAIFPVL
ncbi:MAG: hypothetical protein ACI3X2_08600, partial [Butyricicoccus porcorum]